MDTFDQYIYSSYLYPLKKFVVDYSVKLKNSAWHLQCLGLECLHPGLSELMQQQDINAVSLKWCGKQFVLVKVQCVGCSNS